MKLGGHSLADHLRLLAPLLGIIAAVWVLRMVLYACEAPHFLVHWCSVTLAGAASILLAVILIHLRRFGSYANVFLASFLLSFWREGLISLAIAFSALIGTRNVYMAPEYAGKHLHPLWNIAGHLTFGLGFDTLVGGAMGCLLLWWIRRMEPLKSS